MQFKLDCNADWPGTVSCILRCISYFGHGATLFLSSIPPHMMWWMCHDGYGGTYMYILSI